MNKQDLIDFEKAIAERFDNGEIPYLIHLSGGNEDQLIELFKEIKTGDYVFSTHRNHYHYLLAGGDPVRLQDKILNGKSMFVFDRKLNFYSSSIVCGTAAIAAGVAWALKQKRSTKKVWCFLGDGAEDEGHFYEAARYVDGWSLPCTFIIEDNDRSVIASKKDRWNETSENHCCNFSCVRKYSYKPTWPHGGAGSGKWLKFKKEAFVDKPLLPNEVEERSLKSTIGKIVYYYGYKEAVNKAMQMLAVNNTVFVGYNVGKGDAYGSLREVMITRRLETPLAENLMTGLAMGMTLEGFRGCVVFERHDFIYNALDIMVNQLNIIEFLSQGEFTFPIIIRAIAGSVKPFYAGITHTSNLVELFRKLFSFPVLAPETTEEVTNAYEIALESKQPVLISERKELYV